MGNSIEKSILSVMTDFCAIPNSLINCYRDFGLDNDEVLFLIVLISVKSKHSRLTMKSIENESGYSISEIEQMIPFLIDKGFLLLSPEGDISLEGMFEKIIDYIEWNHRKTEQKIKKPRPAVKDDEVFSDLYIIFEQEIGRPLSPIEGEKIVYWYKTEKFSAELIKEALTKAVLLGKKNFRYIESILFAWRGQGILNLSMLKDYENQRNEEKKRNRANKNAGSRSYRGEQTDFSADDLFELPDDI